MSDNSDKRKKTLIVSMLAFLLTGGGIFLFFVIQGSNDLTGKGKKTSFSYGTAAREGVSSFFRNAGFRFSEDVLAEEKPHFPTREKHLEYALASGTLNPSEPDISDWMAPPAAKAPSYSAKTPVPAMSGGKLSGPGGIGGGGSKSAGSVTRFGGASNEGATSIRQGSGEGITGGPSKGTFGNLKNTKAILSQGLKSGSAATASSKWGQSFGAGGAGKGGDLAYNKDGLVGLDKIKSGEIANLKTNKVGSLKPAEVSDPLKDVEGTKAALAADSKVQKDKEDMNNKIKKEAAQEAINAAAGAVADGAGGKDKDGEGKSGASSPTTPQGEAVPPGIIAAATSEIFTNKITSQGGIMQDQTIAYHKLPSGSYAARYSGTLTVGGVTQPYIQTAILKEDGTIDHWE